MSDGASFIRPPIRTSQRNAARPLSHQDDSLFSDHPSRFTTRSRQAGNKIDFSRDAGFFQQLRLYFFLDRLAGRYAWHKLGTDQKLLDPRDQFIPVPHFRNLHQQLFNEERRIYFFSNRHLILITPPQPHSWKL